MMPIKRLPSRLGARRPNALEQERENSEKLQEVSYRKAINDDEMPFKPKHVRTLIIATHEEKSALTFWKLAHVLSPLATAVTAWKFCHALHMILRDGHKNSLKDTMKNFEFIRSMREHFRHLSHGYGRLIVRYCDLLLCKLNFHRRNPQFPSNLSVKPDELHSIAETDANNYFELAVEMFEYTECILLLYKEGK
ncbi:AP180 N-terminal (ANTH) domain [Trinorchestia longiramus]|nr:AP180 N-terminal (ANTH) domain [Trinorchestia longiramus]